MNKTISVTVAGILIAFCAVGTAQAIEEQNQIPQISVCDSETDDAYELCVNYCESLDCDSEIPAGTMETCNQTREQYIEITAMDLPCESICPCFDHDDLLSFGQVLRCFTDSNEENKTVEFENAHALTYKFTDTTEETRCEITDTGVTFNYANINTTEEEHNSCKRLLQNICHSFDDKDETESE